MNWDGFFVGLICGSIGNGCYWWGRRAEQKHWVEQLRRGELVFPLKQAPREDLERMSALAAAAEVVEP